MADGGRFVVEPSSVEMRTRAQGSRRIVRRRSTWLTAGSSGVLLFGELPSRASNRKVCVCVRECVCVRVCYRAVNCLLSNVSVVLQQSLADCARSCRVSQSVAVCCGSVKNKSVVSDVVVYQVRTDRRRWRIRRSSSTRTWRSKVEEWDTAVQSQR